MSFSKGSSLKLNDDPLLTSVLLETLPPTQDLVDDDNDSDFVVQGPMLFKLFYVLNLLMFVVR